MSTLVKIALAIGLQILSSTAHARTAHFSTPFAGRCPDDYVIVAINVHNAGASSQTVKLSADVYGGVRTGACWQHFNSTDEPSLPAGHVYLNPQIQAKQLLGSIGPANRILSAGATAGSGDWVNLAPGGTVQYWVQLYPSSGSGEIHGDLEALESVGELVANGVVQMSAATMSNLRATTRFVINNPASAR
jgi:hypothetical protein